MLTFIHVFFNFVWRTLLYTYLCSLAFTADCYINYIIVICGASYFVSRRYSTEQSIMHKPTITPIQGSRDPFLHFGAIPSERVKVSISNLHYTDVKIPQYGGVLIRITRPLKISRSRAVFKGGGKLGSCPLPRGLHN